LVGRFGLASEVAGRRLDSTAAMRTGVCKYIVKRKGKERE
jgi:hypothetical protein